MPCNRTLLHLNMTPSRPLRIIPKNLRHLLHPAHIQASGEIHPRGAVRRTDESSVLRAHPETRKVAEVLLEERLVTAGYDVYDVVWVGRDFCEGCERVGRRERHRGHLDDRRERALSVKCQRRAPYPSPSTHVVIEQEQTLPGVIIQLLEPVSRDVRRLTRGVLSVNLREEHLGKDRSPRVRGVSRHD